MDAFNIFWNYNLDANAKALASLGAVNSPNWNQYRKTCCKVVYQFILYFSLLLQSEVSHSIIVLLCSLSLFSALSRSSINCFGVIPNAWCKVICCRIELVGSNIPVRHARSKSGYLYSPSFVAG